LRGEAMRTIRGAAGYVFGTVVIGAILAAIAPMLVLPYIVIAVIGAIFGWVDGGKAGPAASSSPSGPKWGEPSQRRGDVSPRRGGPPPAFSKANLDSMMTGYMASRTKVYETCEAKAASVRQQPWFADAQVDMDSVNAKWSMAYGPIASETDLPWLLVPNPFFVLSLPKLVEWRFVSPLYVREALRWANSPTPPIRWQNPRMTRVINLMGWSPTEVWARIGLLFWSMAPEAPTPADAQAETEARSRGQVFDVPRPVALD
jgi:hypothetical protein